MSICSTISKNKINSFNLFSFQVMICVLDARRIWKVSKCFASVCLRPTFHSRTILGPDMSSGYVFTTSINVGRHISCLRMFPLVTAILDRVPFFENKICNNDECRRHQHTDRMGDMMPYEKWLSIYENSGNALHILTQLSSWTAA